MIRDFIISPSFQLIWAMIWPAANFLEKMKQTTLASLRYRHFHKLILSSCNSRNKLTATADSVILLWMAGGMAHTETFDPKAYTPFTTGMDSKSVISTFKAIPTALDGIQFSEGLEGIAGTLDKGTLIRSYRAAGFGFLYYIRVINITGIPAINHPGIPTTAYRCMDC